MFVTQTDQERGQFTAKRLEGKGVTYNALQRDGRPRVSDHIKTSSHKYIISTNKAEADC